MPLRVAEKDGYLKAVNKCYECPFFSRMMIGIKAHFRGEHPTSTGCFHDKIATTQGKHKIGREVKPHYIPVWCPLPEPGVSKKDIKEIIDLLREGNRRKDEIISSFLNGIPKTATEMMIMEENKLRGKHPENIVFEQPEIFIVESAEETDVGGDFYVKVKPSKEMSFGSPGSGNWASLMAGDILISPKKDSTIQCIIIKTPTSNTIEMSLVGKIKKGDELIWISGSSREEPK